MKKWKWNCFYFCSFLVWPSFHFIPTTYIYFFHKYMYKDLQYKKQTKKRRNWIFYHWLFVKNFVGFNVASSYLYIYMFYPLLFIGMVLSLLYSVLFRFHWFKRSELLRTKRENKLEKERRQAGKAIPYSVLWTLHDADLVVIIYF